MELHLNCNQHKLAVLGCGNMATAILKGFAPTTKNFSYFLYTPTQTRAVILAKMTGGKAITKLSDLPSCDFYLIACKPQQFEVLAKDLNPLLSKNGVIVSVMAGVSTKTMMQKLPNAKKFVRTMPNTPCLIGEGVTGMFFTPNMTREEKKIVEEIFSAVSKVFVFDDEEMLDVTVAATGSGPAYVFEAALDIAQKMISLGMKKNTAFDMVKQLFKGSSLLMEKSEESPEELRKKVTSKGGTTEAALNVLWKEDLKGIFDRAIDAAYTRAKELSK